MNKNSLWAVLAVGLIVGMVVYLIWDERHRASVAAQLEQESEHLKEKISEDERKSAESLARINRDIDDQIRINRAAAEMLKSDAYTSDQVNAWEANEKQKLLERQRHEELLDAVKSSGTAPR